MPRSTSVAAVNAVRESAVSRCSSANRKAPFAARSDHYVHRFSTTVLVGAKRFAHAALLRGDQGLHALMGIQRFPIDDTIRNLFRRFSMGNVQRLYEPLAEWQMQRLPLRSEGYTLDLDSTVLERYGKQEGSLKGHNPRKHGRPSHHPLLAMLSEAHFLLHGWLRSGNCGTARGLRNFSKKLWRYGDSARRSVC